MKIRFDVTIFAPIHNHAKISYHSKKGKKFVEQIANSLWTPVEVMQNVPPNVLVGVRTSVRKKFALVPPLSLH